MYFILFLYYWTDPYEVSIMVKEPKANKSSVILP